MQNDISTAQGIAGSRRGFFKKTALALAAASLLLGGAVQAADLEKEDLKFGFIKLTDMAPLAIA